MADNLQRLSFAHSHQANIDPAFRSILESIGQPLTITSGWRSAAGNAAAGGAPQSYHLSGKAVDIDMGGMGDQERAGLVEKLRTAGVRRFGTYDRHPNMLHVDMGGDGSNHYMHNKTARELDRAPDWFKGVAFQGPAATSLASVQRVQPTRGPREGNQFADLLTAQAAPTGLSEGNQFADLLTAPDDSQDQGLSEGNQFAHLLDTPDSPSLVSEGNQFAGLLNEPETAPAPEPEVPDPRPAWSPVRQVRETLDIQPDEMAALPEMPQAGQLDPLPVLPMIEGQPVVGGGIPPDAAAALQARIQAAPVPDPIERGPDPNAVDMRDRPDWFERLTAAAGRSRPFEVNAAQAMVDRAGPVDPATGRRLSADEVRTARLAREQADYERRMPAPVTIGEQAADVVGGMVGKLRDPLALILGPAGAARAALPRAAELAGIWGGYAATDAAAEQAANEGRVDPGTVALAGGLGAGAAVGLDQLIRGGAALLRGRGRGQATLAETPDGGGDRGESAVPGGAGELSTDVRGGPEGLRVRSPATGPGGDPVSPGLRAPDDAPASLAAGPVASAPESATGARYVTLRPSDIQVDAKRFQFRQEADQQGDTGRLAGVQQWDPDAAGAPLVWQDQEGAYWVADGHHRVNLAKRLEAEGQDIVLDARVLREADGVSAADARKIAATKNVQEGNSDPIDIARLFREQSPEERTATAPRLPRVGNAAIRDGEALATLGPDAWDLVRTRQVPANHAAEVARVLSDPAEQQAALGYLMRRPAENAQQARLVAEQMRDAGFRSDAGAVEQGDLFGGGDILDSLFLERAQVIHAAVRGIMQDKRVFAALDREAGRIEAAGNVLARDANQARVAAAGRLAELLRTQANTRGDLSNAINVAAERVRAGSRPDVEARVVVGLVSDADRGAAEGVGRGGAVDRGGEGVQGAQAGGAEGAGSAGGELSGELPKRGDQNGVQISEEGRGRAEASADGSGNRPELNLSGQSPAEIISQERARKAAEAAAREQAQRDNAPSPDDFVLSGSDAEADQLAARGQQSLFARGGDSVPWRGQAAAGSAAGPAPRPDEIVQDLSRALDVPIGYRRFWAGAKGIFKMPAGTIRLQGMNDLETVSHEVGHLLEQRFPDLGLLARQHRSELTPMASPGPDPVAEGFAEFMRLRLSQPGQAAQRAPGFARDFEALLAQHPAERDVLDRAAANIDAWFRQSPEDQLGSLIGPRPRSLGERVDDLPARAVFNLLDKFDPIKRVTRDLAGGEALAARDDPYAMARLAAGTDGIIDHFVRAGTLPFEFTARARGPIGPGLAEVLRPVRARAEEFQRYMIARRAEELRGQGRERLFSDAQIQGTLRAYDSPEFRAAFDGVVTFQDEVLQYAVDGGLISEDLAARVRAANQNYVPFKRVFGSADGAARARRSTGDQQNPLRRLQGAALNVQNPLQSILDNTALLITATNRNYAAATLARLAEGAVGTGGRALERLPPGVQAQRVRTDDIVSLFEREGQQIDPTVAQALGEWSTFFTAGPQVDKQWNQINIQMDGKPVTFQVNDPLLFESLTHMAPPEANSVEALLSMVGRTLRAGVVFEPSYMLRNLSRDQLTAWVQSSHGYKPVVDAFRGMAKVVTRDPLFWKFQAFGGGQSSFWAVQDKDAARLIGDVLGARPPGANPASWAALSSARAAGRFVERLGEMTEMGSRMGEFRRALQASGDAGDVALAAALAGREVSTDFAMRGASRSLYFLSRITPFLNAGVQGLYKGARTLGEHGFRDSFLPTVTKVATGITLPSVALYLWTRDEPWYKDIPDTEKAMYWHLPPLSEGGAPVRIAKPFEFGFLGGTAPTMLIDAWESDLKAREGVRFARAAMQVFGLRVAPPALLVPVELKTNYNFFRGAPIVPPFVDPGPYDYQAYTSEAAKAIAKAAGVSSLKVEHAVRGLFGSLGAQALLGADLMMRAIDADLPSRPAMKVTELPGLAAFFSKSPPTSSQPTQELYRILAETTAALGSVRKLRTEGNEAEADALAGRLEREGVPGMHAQANLWSKAATVDRKALKELAFDKGLAGDEKRAKMDVLQRDMNDSARSGLDEVLNEMRRAKAVAP